MSEQKQQFQDVEYSAISGGIAFMMLLLLFVVDGFSFFMGITGVVLGSLGAFFLVIAALSGFTVLNPNEAVVLMFLGEYKGTLKEPGFWYVPFYWSGQKVSIKVVSHETDGSKVNDKAGNPINISAVILWRVNNAVQSVLGVDNAASIITQQADSALRAVAARYRYDHASPDDNSTETTLRDGQDEVAKELATEVGHRINVAGVEVLEARITKLSYASEIAGVMLQRQQAEATIAARTRLIEGITTIVSSTVEKLKKDENMDFDAKTASQMAANLMIVLAGERGVQPVVNVGTEQKS